MMTDIAGARALVVMGVTATGKSTLGRALASRLGWAFTDGDDLHDTHNIAKMRDGHALTDADRADWLARVRDWIVTQRAEKRSCVIACSALKRRYRDAIAHGQPRVAFVALEADVVTLRARLQARTGHFMPLSLLASQLADYEPPDADERALRISSHRPLAQQVADVMAALTP